MSSHFDSATRGIALPPITLTDTDQRRLRALLDTRVGVAYRAEARRLRDELRRATVVPPESISSEIVTMNSIVIYADVEARQTRRATLVYPWRGAERLALSVFTPVGTALLGLGVGERIAWRLDDQAVKILRVLALVYQPEAAGDWHL
jgi:regulator of nucleoside diphosphate kinase